MVEIMEVPEVIDTERHVKHENDESYRSAESGIGEGEESSVSVVCKIEANDSSGYESKSGLLVEDGKLLAEIFDIERFNPPILNSTNVDIKGKICDISTIENDGAMPKSVQGNTFD